MESPSRPPEWASQAWIAIELLMAATLVAAGIRGYVPFSATPWLLIVVAVSLWWRGPGWRAIGLARPASWIRVLGIGLLIGVGYQLLGLYVIEPAIAWLTSSRLPDVSAFRPLVGNEVQLAFWLAMSWTLAAFMEEIVFRGWLMTRLAELGRFSPASWIAAAVASSAVFGVVHLYQGLSGVLATGLTGLVFAAVYLGTHRNLWACILAHGILDTAGFLLIYFGAYPGL